MTAVPMPQTITVKTRNNGTPIVLVTGGFQFGDEVEFRARTNSLSTAVVVLQSPGGSAVAGIRIGRAIRAKRFTTLIADEYSSACAVAWLGGSRRLMTATAHIGFHGCPILPGGGLMVTRGLHSSPP
jgi:hypothetical protein